MEMDSEGNEVLVEVMLLKRDVWVLIEICEWGNRILNERMGNLM